MSELTRDEHLRLIELEIKNLEFLYKSYPDHGSEGNRLYPSGGDPRRDYIGVAHAESRRMLDEFYEKWEIDRL